jgi:MOSC domain-containing protein YiiM
MKIRHLYLASGHSFFGRKGMGSRPNPMEEVDHVECVAGQGLKGDRFFNYKPDYKGQATFFAWETLVTMWDELGVEEERRCPAATRRNIITEGVGLNSLIGEEFELQGVKFQGIEECRPCFWMNEAIHPDAEQWMRGRGGLRAKILTDGVLRRDLAA